MTRGRISPPAPGDVWALRADPDAVLDLPPPVAGQDDLTCPGERCALPPRRKPYCEHWVLRADLREHAVRHVLQPRCQPRARRCRRWCRGGAR